MASGRKVSGANRTLVSDRGLQHQNVKVLHETFSVPVLMYGRGR